MSRRSSEIIGLFTQPSDIQERERQRISQEAGMFTDPINRIAYQSAAGLAGGLGGLAGFQPRGMQEQQQIQSALGEVPFDVDNQSEYYTNLGQNLINQGLYGAGYQALELARTARVDEARIRKDEAAKKGSAGKLTAPDKDAIREATATAKSARFRAQTAGNLAKRFITERPLAGAPAQVFSSFKRFLGAQNTSIDLLLKEYEVLQRSDAMANLPPGAASDADVRLSMSRFPDKNDNAAYIASFLLGVQKVSALEAEYQNFYAKYLRDNFGSSAGIDDAWAEFSESEDFKNMLNERYGITYREDPAVTAATPSPAQGDTAEEGVIDFNEVQAQPETQSGVDPDIIGLPGTVPMSERGPAIRPVPDIGSRAEIEAGYGPTVDAILNYRGLDDTGMTLREKVTDPVGAVRESIRERF